MTARTVTDPRHRTATCPHCAQAFDYERYHAGFSSLGFMYCDRDETVVTWETYSPGYGRIVDTVPWALNRDEQRRVEEAIKPCSCGGRFAFANPPRCPKCFEPVGFLVPAAIYVIVTGRRVDADADEMWAAPRPSPQ